jgi:hypothetical protein
MRIENTENNIFIYSKKLIGDKEYFQYIKKQMIQLQLGYLIALKYLS